MSAFPIQRATMFSLAKPLKLKLLKTPQIKRSIGPFLSLPLHGWVLHISLKNQQSQNGNFFSNGDLCKILISNSCCKTCYVETWIKLHLLSLFQFKQSILSICKYNSHPPALIRNWWMSEFLSFSEYLGGLVPVLYWWLKPGLASNTKPYVPSIDLAHIKVKSYSGILSLKL